MTSPGRQPADALQRATLTRAFLSRFFENEITGGSNDLKTTYFWMIGFLATPGFLIPIYMMWNWEVTARFQGLHALRILAMPDKAVYLSLALTATGLLTAITWNSLLLDRRDALILGTLPVRAALVVRAKLLALAAYLGVLIGGMHGLASLTFGVLLASENTFGFLLRGIAAHAFAAASSRVFVVLAVTAIQGTALALAGPRVFSRISPILQALLIGSVLLGLTTLPALSDAVQQRFGETGPPPDIAWMAFTPAIWFLGSYEWALGSHDPMLVAMHWRGMMALGVAGVLTLTSFPLAYRRLMSVAVEGDQASMPRQTRWTLVEWLVPIAGANPAARASAQFFFASIARVERLRFAIAAAIGLVAGWSLPSLAFLTSRATSHAPTTALLALSLADLCFLIVGLRVAIALPADVRSNWMTVVMDAPAPRLRSGVWRAMFAMAVVPFALICVPLCWWLWGPVVAGLHLLLLVAAGALLIELLLWKWAEMPCANLWRPDQAQLGKRWPLYMIAFLVFTAGLARIAMWLLETPVSFVVFIAILIGLTLVIRRSHNRQVRLPFEEPDVVGAPTVLNLQ